jgi:site-specific DNA-methyltransferase (adenine-specific)
VYNDKRAARDGKVPDDVWLLRPSEAEQQGFFAPDQDVWHHPRVCGTFRERVGWHNCQMPMAILNRIVSACSNPRDIVLDPFSGSGTTCESALRLGRRFLGIDISPAYATKSNERLDTAAIQLASE